MKEYNSITPELLRIQGSLQRFQAGKESFFEGLAELESPILDVYSPEVPVSPSNVFDILYLKKADEDYTLMTLSRRHWIN